MPANPTAYTHPRLEYVFDDPPLHPFGSFVVEGLPFRSRAITAMSCDPGDGYPPPPGPQLGFQRV